MRSLKGFIVALVLVQTPQIQAQVTNYATQGNLQSTAPIECIALDTVTNSHTPADIYPGVAKCVNSGDYDKASQLFALAGVYGKFDQLRVSDPTAGQAVQVLQLNTFGSFTKDQKEQLMSAIRKVAEPGSTQFSALCSKLNAIGRPNYNPTYMIQHGMGAVLGNAAPGIKAHFDATQGWKDALVNYMHCS